MASQWPTGIRPSGKGIRVTVWRGGKAIYDKTVGGDPFKSSDLAAAVRHRDEIKSKVRLGLPVSDSDTGAALRPFPMMAQRYLETRPVDESTAQNYVSWINRHWMPAFERKTVEEITRRDIEDRLASLPLAPATKRAVLSPLAGVFNYAGIHPNPAAGIAIERKTRGRVERYTPAERDAVLSQMTGQARVYFSLLFGTGLRPGEALALTWADYDGDHLWITKQRTRGRLKDYTKTKADRRVYVPEWVRERLNGHDTRLKGDHVFVSRQGTPLHKPEQLNKMWVKAHGTARVGAHPVRRRRPYTTRHTRASELLSMGVNPAEAANQLGHSVQMFLEIYARFVGEYVSRVDFSMFEGRSPAKNQRARGR